MRLLLTSLLFISLYASPVFSQNIPTAEALFDRVEKIYKTEKQYCYHSRYLFYGNENASKPIEEYAGIIYKNENVKYQRIKGIEFADFGEYNVMINHDEKVFQVGKIENNNSPIALKSFLKMFPNHAVKQTKDFYICELKSGKLSQTTIEKVVIYIHKDYSLAKQVFYFTGGNEMIVNSKKIKLYNPRLEVSFKKVLKFEEIKQQDFYIIKNKKIVASDKYKNYKVIIL